jgi:hypothetical protein
MSVDDTTLDALVKELRGFIRNGWEKPGGILKAIEKAATELSRLSKENATLQARVGELEAEFDGAGWVYFSPDAGTEYAEAHPVESGETPDATDIRKATGTEDCLYAEIQRQFQRANKLEAELVEAKRERDEARGIMPSKVWNEIFEAPANFLTGHREHYYANYQIVREAHQRAKEQCPLAADVIMAQAFFQAVASEREEIAWKEVLDERARAEAAESSLAAAKERLATLRNEVLEEAAKIADEERDCAATDAYDDRQALGAQYDPNCYGAGYDAGRKAAAEQIAAAIRSQCEP